MEQRSEEWYQARLGKATASRFADVLARLKSGIETASRKNYRAQLVVERLTGVATESYSSKAMEWGVETESLARTAYMLATGNQVEEVGFVEHENLAAGASPDGLIGKDGLLEIKCPNTANHIEYLIKGELPNIYEAQVQGQMWMTGRKWCDFVSYDPRLPANNEMLIVRVKRDEQFINMLADEVRAFLTTVDETVKLLEGYNK